MTEVDTRSYSRISGQTFRRQRDVEAGDDRSQELGGSLLVRRIGIGMQERDRHALDPVGRQLLRHGTHVRFVQSETDLAASIHALADREAQRPFDQRLGTYQRKLILILSLIHI